MRAKKITIEFLEKVGDGTVCVIVHAPLDTGNGYMSSVEVPRKTEPLAIAAAISAVTSFFSGASSSGVKFLPPKEKDRAIRR